MGKVIKVNFDNNKNHHENFYKQKLIRIRDEIEEYLLASGLYEDDELAVALASGRFAIMKLTQMTGENETIDFVNDIEFHDIMTKAETKEGIVTIKKEKIESPEFKQSLDVKPKSVQKQKEKQAEKHNNRRAG